MSKIDRTFALILSLMVALSCVTFLAVKPANTQATPDPNALPTPSVPEFTVKYIDRSYDAPLTATATTDPYTGKQITTSSGGYHVQNRTMELTIRNQFFNSAYDSKAQQDYGFYYNVSSRGHFGGEWRNSSSPVSASNSQYTTLIFGLNGRESTDTMVDLGNLDLGSALDFKVQALVGYYTQIDDSPTQFGAWWHWEFTGQSSDWSSAQTAAIPETSNSVTPTPNPSVPEFSWLLILPLLLSAFTVAVVLRYRKTPN